MSETARVGEQNMGDNCKYWHLPSNGVIADIALPDLNLIWSSNIFNILHFFKWYELA